ncbi:hypothetical protein FO519_007920 [Halicephalobus sp. NKZ332]|nr:hypothetical protein FO519_007920 [Halicephalobus sp. NKZ332]
MAESESKSPKPDIDGQESENLLNSSDAGAKELDVIEAKKALGTMEEEDPAQPRIILKVYPRRWIVLLVVALLNNSNTMSWIAFAPIANHVDGFYDKINATNWFSMIYMLCTIPVGVAAMWLGRTLGLRWAILIAAWTNGIGGLIRLGSTFLSPEYRFPVGIFGQAIAAIAYPFIMFLPTKVAAAWFPDNQRAFATTVGIMSNPLGVLLANLISPQIVQDPSHVIRVNIMTAVPSLIACVLATAVITRSEPKHPPTISASKKQMDFLPGIKSCFTNKEYLILLFVMGGGIGLFNCLYTVMQQLLCPAGYGNAFSGFCAVLMIVGGVVGATIAGIFVDKTKKFEETLKIAMGVACFFGVIFLQLALRPNYGYFILGLCFVFGVMGLAAYPVGLELSAEVSFPVSETTSTGLIVLSGQIQSVIFVALMTKFAKPLADEYMKNQVCRDPGKNEEIAVNDFTVSNIVMTVVALILCIVLVALFHPKYRRMEAEKGYEAPKITKTTTGDLETGAKELQPLKE